MTQGSTIIQINLLMAKNKFISYLKIAKNYLPKNRIDDALDANQHEHLQQLTTSSVLEYSFQSNNRIE